MKLVVFVLFFLLFSCSSKQNEPEINPEKMSEEVVWIKDSLIQGYSGATALGDLSDYEYNDSFKGLLKNSE